MATATKTDMTVARIILAQLGGNRFALMTGAKNMAGHSDALSFRLPSRFATGGINYVKVTLNAMDTYDLEFGKVWGSNYRVIDTARGIYADNLRRVFTATTGLDTTL